MEIQMKVEKLLKSLIDHTPRLTWKVYDADPKIALCTKIGKHILFLDKTTKEVITYVFSIRKGESNITEAIWISGLVSTNTRRLMTTLYEVALDSATNNKTIVKTVYEDLLKLEEI